MANGVYVATVQKIFPKGKHGPYAKARVKTLGTVTFSLDSPVWREAKWPEEGTYVLVADLLKKTAGWRADMCRFMRPEDEATTETATATSDERKGASHG